MVRIHRIIRRLRWWLYRRRWNCPDLSYRDWFLTVAAPPSDLALWR